MTHMTLAPRSGPIFAALAAVAAVLAAPASAQASSGTTTTTTALYQRFTVDLSGEWTNVALRLDPLAWHVGGPDGPATTPKQWATAMGALKSLVIGADCAPIVRGPTTYPSSFGLARAVLDNDKPTDVSMQDWQSTSAMTHRSTELHMVSAVATPQTPAPASSLNVDRQFVGLIAPSPLRDKVAGMNASVLRVQVRCSSTPVADAQARVGQGLLILSADAVEPPTPPPAVDTGADVVLELNRRAKQRRDRAASGP